MSSIINATTTNGLKFQPDNSGSLVLQTNNGTTAVTIDTSQNVGIGTTSPSAKLQANSTYATTWNTNDSTAAGYTPQSNELAIINNQNATTNSWAGIFFQGGQASTNTQLHTARIACLNDGTTYGGALAFATRDASTANSVERMRIDSSGNVGIGTSSPTYKLDISSGNSNTLNITTNNTNTTIFNITRSTVTTVTHTLDNTGYKIINGGSGGLYLGYTGTSWTSLSDERFKTDLKPIENAVEKVSTLRAVTGRFKTDDESKSRSFLIAQDIQAVLPEAVDTSNPEQLGVSYTDTIPLLVAAIKEQQTIINDLKARIETLEAK